MKTIMAGETTLAAADMSNLKTTETNHNDRDIAYFAAEHDDYHVARIGELVRALR